MKKLLTVFFILLLVGTPTFAETFYEKEGGLESVLKTRKLTSFVNNDNQTVITLEYNSLNQLIKINRINSNYPIELTYDANGKLVEYDIYAVQYNKDGTIKKLSPLDKVIYNEKGKIIQIGKYNLTYDETDTINKISRTKSNIWGDKPEYYAKYETKNNNIQSCYERMIADQFFNKYKNSLKKYNNYYNFRTDIDLATQDSVPKQDIKRYTDLIDKFNNIYTNYIAMPYKYNLLSSNEKKWFQEQVMQTENWMKSHNINYENYYEKQYKASSRINEAILNKSKTESELLMEEIQSLKSQITRLEKNSSTSNKIYSIGGKRVEYSGDRIYSIGGERVKY